MNALERGLKRGREYLLRFSCDYIREHMTFAEYKAIGHIDAKQQYPSKKGQANFLLGWWASGEQFIELFRPDDAEFYGAQQKITYVLTRLESVCKDTEPLLTWRADDSIVNGYVLDTYNALELAKYHLKQLQAHLTKREVEHDGR